MPVLGKRNTAQYLYPPARKIKESMNKILSQNTDCMLIHNFIETSERITPENPRFHGQLMHVRELLEQSVLRHVNGTPPDGEITLNQSDIDRGYAQFSPAMY
jgi:hypothetical protein